MKTYYEWIDISKGIGIILVILGHSMFPFHFLIDSFHMPLFFFIGGLTFRTKPLERFLVEKIDRIMVPYVFWAILSAFISLIPHNYEGPFNGPLWFFPAIFTSLLLIYFIESIEPKYKKISLLFILFVIFYTWLMIKWEYFKVLPFSLDIALLSSGFMLAGVRCGVLKNKFNTKKSQLILIILSGLVFFTLVTYIYLKFHPIGAYNSLHLYDNNYILGLLCSLSGILVTIGVAKYIKTSKILSWFGKNSMVLMCVHFPFCQMINVYCSKTAIFNLFYGKIILALFEYIIVFSISILLTIFLRKYLPKLNGYTPFIKDYYSAK